MTPDENESKKKLRAAFYARLSSGNLTTIASKTGIARNTLYSWQTPGRGLPDIFEVAAIAEALGTTPCHLAFGSGAATVQEEMVLEALRQFEAPPIETILKMIEALPMPRKQFVKKPALPPPLTVEKIIKPKPAELIRREMPDMHELPVVDKIAADHMPTFAESKGEAEFVEVKYSKKDHYCLLVKGRSMHPTIMEGDIVIMRRVYMKLDELLDEVGPADKQAWKALDKEIVAASVDDEDPVLKRIMVYDRKKTGFKVFLTSDNRAAKQIEITEESRLKVFGVVQKIMRDPKTFE